MNETLEALVASEIKPLGLELFELKFGGSRARPVLDVRVEGEGGEKVSVDDGGAASRAIERRLDAEDFGGGRYVLEVSSPGIERPLRNAKDWKRFVGRSAVVTANVAGDPAGRGTGGGGIAGGGGGNGGKKGVRRSERGEGGAVPAGAPAKSRAAGFL